MEEEKQPILIQYIKNRIYYQNKNFVMIFVGPTGSGKSLATLRLAEMLDSTFNIDRVCFKPVEFMNCINKLVEDSNKGEDIRCKVVMWDELGASHSAREFMTISNRVMNYFFQTSRHLNLIVLMTVPLLSFVDSNTRKLCHGIAEMKGINTKEKYSTVRVKMVQTNVMTGKEYPKYLRYKKNNKTFKSAQLRFKLPSAPMLDAYETKKKAFTTALNKEIMAKLVRAEDKNNPRDILTDTQADYLELYKKFNENAKKVAEYLGTSVQNVYKHLRKAKIEQLNSINQQPPQNQPKLGAGLDSNDVTRVEESKEHE